MLFREFASQDERRNLGGSAFIELQYCKLKRGAKLKKIVSVYSIEHWKNDSLYIHVDDMEEFYTLYSDIFRNDFYNNGECGIVDMFGTNYYTLEQALFIIERIKSESPKDCQVLLKWLANVKEYNGFYILGV